MSSNISIQQLLEMGREFGAWTVLFHEAMATKIGIGATDLKCLSFIQQQPQGISAGAIAQYAGLTTGSATALLDRLEASGFVRRERDASDRRKVLVYINADKQEILNQMYAPFAQLATEHYNEFSSEQRATIAAFLDKGIALLKEQVRAVE